jgi:hypothetical protein
VHVRSFVFHGLRSSPKERFDSAMSLVYERRSAENAEEEKVCENGAPAYTNPYSVSKSSHHI